MSEEKLKPIIIRYAKSTLYTYVSATILTGVFGAYLIFGLNEIAFGIGAILLSIIYGLYKYYRLMNMTPTLKLDLSGMKWNEDFCPWKEISDIESNHDQHEEVVKFKFKDELKEIDLTEFDIRHNELRSLMLRFKTLNENEGT